ncbi:hypothetical protein [Amycolatopsis sp. WGS_07]
MPAVIYLDPAAILPVIENVWHRTRLSQVPAPRQRQPRSKRLPSADLAVR